MKRPQGNGVAPDERTPLTRHARVLVALGIGAVCGLGSFAATRLSMQGDQDFKSWWLAARAVLADRNPYTTVVWSGGGSGFVYPLPAALATVPFAWLRPSIAGALFIALSCGMLAFVVTRRAWWPLFMFASGSMVSTVISAQWSALLTLGVALPALAWLGIIKPNVGLALFAARPSRRSAAIAFCVTSASLVFMPSWPVAWWHAAAASTVHRAPWRVLGGPILFLAVTKWRRPEGRLLTVLALVPSSPIAYEALPLFVIPSSRREMLLLAITSAAVVLLTSSISLAAEPERYMRIAEPSMVWLIYLPALAMVLRRPNEGQVPERIERAVARWPWWLRGGQGTRT